MQRFVHDGGPIFLRKPRRAAYCLRDLPLAFAQDSVALAFRAQRQAFPLDAGVGDRSGGFCGGRRRRAHGDQARFPPFFAETLHYGAEERRQPVAGHSLAQRRLGDAEAACGEILANVSLVDERISLKRADVFDAAACRPRAFPALGAIDAPQPVFHPLNGEVHAFADLASAVVVDEGSRQDRVKDVVARAALRMTVADARCRDRPRLGPGDGKAHVTLYFVAPGLQVGAQTGAVFQPVAAVNGGSVLPHGAGAALLQRPVQVAQLDRFLELIHKKAAVIAGTRLAARPHRRQLFPLFSGQGKRLLALRGAVFGHCSAFVKTTLANALLE